MRSICTPIWVAVCLGMHWPLKAGMSYGQLNQQRIPHTPKRTLPTPQQVYCSSQIDVLLAEVVRIMK